MPSGSIPQISLDSSTEAALAQFVIVSFRGISSAVLPKPVGLINPEAVEPSGRLMVIVSRISIAPFSIFIL